jgi:hypothetical protein
VWLTEEDSGMLMPSVCDCCNSYCAREKEEDSGMLMSSVYNCAVVPRRIFFFHAIKLQILSETIIYVVWYKKEKFISVQVKNKPCDEGTEHAFILGSMVCTVANTYGVWPECHWGL